MWDSKRAFGRVEVAGVGSSEKLFSLVWLTAVWIVAYDGVDFCDYRVIFPFADTENPLLKSLFRFPSDVVSLLRYQIRSLIERTAVTCCVLNIHKCRIRHENQLVFQLGHGSSLCLSSLEMTA